jgi:hypothetical protein
LSALVAMRVLFILGIVNMVTGLVLFFTCRCLPGSKIGKSLMTLHWYRGFFRFHCYIWWIFWVSVVAHAILAMRYIGWPF